MDLIFPSAFVASLAYSAAPGVINAEKRCGARSRVALAPRCASSSARSLAMRCGPPLR